MSDMEDTLEVCLIELVDWPNRLKKTAFDRMYSLFRSVCSYVYVYLRPYLKWFLRRTTGLCEFQRICYGESKGARRAHLFEYSIRRSRCKIIRALVEQLDVFCANRRLHGENGNQIVEFSAGALIKAKKINIAVHKGLRYPLTVCLAQIFGYKQLIEEVEQVRKITFSSANSQHEEKLLKLWATLMPDIPLEGRISRQWTDIGFQGDDPRTDFRGMGLLGLECLIFFSTQYTGTARHVLSHSHHPHYGYSFAIVGINLTSMAFELLTTDVLKTHLFNVVPGRSSLKHFYQVYVYLFYEFDKFWLAEKPRDIMEFGRISDKFRARILSLLRAPDGILRLNFCVETI